jgi:hypothetical protein
VYAASAATPCANEKVQAANRANAARSTGPRTRAGKQRSARNALRHGLSQPVLADPGLAAEAADLAGRIAGEDATEPRRAAALRVAEAQVDLQRIRRVREQIMVEGFAAAGDITARLMRLDRYERRALSRRKSAIRAFDSLERPAAPPRPGRNPWAAVAAAAKLGGLWQNEPGVGGTRDPWAAVAAAAGLGGVWQNKPDFGRARLQRAAVAAAGRRAVRQNEADFAGVSAVMCASPEGARSTIVRDDERSQPHRRCPLPHAAPDAARLARPRGRLAPSRPLRPGSPTRSSARAATASPTRCSQGPPAVMHSLAARLRPHECHARRHDSASPRC